MENNLILTRLNGGQKLHYTLVNSTRIIVIKLSLEATVPVGDGNGIVMGR